jgi:hypothetical protein
MAKVINHTNLGDVDGRREVKQRGRFRDQVAIQVVRLASDQDVPVSQSQTSSHPSFKSRICLRVNFPELWIDLGENLSVLAAS